MIPELLGLAALAAASTSKDDGPVKPAESISLLFEMSGPRPLGSRGGRRGSRIQAFLVLNLTEELLLTWLQRLDRLKQIRDDNQQLLGSKLEATIGVSDGLAVFRFDHMPGRDPWLTELIENQNKALRLRIPHLMLKTSRQLRIALKLKRFGELDADSSGAPLAIDRLVTADQMKVVFAVIPRGSQVRIEAELPKVYNGTFHGMFFGETLVDLLSILRESQL